MAATHSTRKGVRKLKDVDDIIRIFTGKRIGDHAQWIFGLIREDIESKVAGGEKETDKIPETGPYAVLHCRPGCNNDVLKYRFRSLVRELHPDSGKFPDPAQYQKVVEAYNTIQAERKNDAAQKPSAGTP